MPASPRQCATERRRVGHTGRRESWDGAGHARTSPPRGGLPTFNRRIGCVGDASRQLVDQSLRKHSERVIGSRQGANQRIYRESNCQLLGYR